MGAGGHERKAGTRKKKDEVRVDEECNVLRNDRVDDRGSRRLRVQMTTGVGMQVRRNIDPLRHLHWPPKK